MIARLRCMGILPTIEIGRMCVAHGTWEAEGVVIIIRWGSLAIEQFLGRIDRTFENKEPEDNHDIGK